MTVTHGRYLRLGDNYLLVSGKQWVFMSGKVHPSVLEASALLR
jgi:hypothetical protein